LDTEKDVDFSELLDEILTSGLMGRKPNLARGYIYSTIYYNEKKKGERKYNQFG
jgi:hypothetical protein